MSEKKEFTNEEAKSKFRHIILECAKVVPAVKSHNPDDEQSVKNLYAEHLGPIICDIEELCSRYLYLYNLNIGFKRFPKNNLPFLLFFILTPDIYLFEIFKKANLERVREAFEKDFPEIFIQESPCAAPYEPCRTTVQELTVLIQRRADMKRD